MGTHKGTQVHGKQGGSAHPVLQVVQLLAQRLLGVPAAEGAVTRRLHSGYTVVTGGYTAVT